MLYKIVTSLTRTQKQFLFMLTDAGMIAVAMISALTLNAATHATHPDTIRLTLLVLSLDGVDAPSRHRCAKVAVSKFATRRKRPWRRLAL
jgi:hypothetical protein